MRGRTFDRVTCPECRRLISAYVPFGGDGASLTLVLHGRQPSKGRPGPVVPCPLSGEELVRDRGTGLWKQPE